MAKFQIELVVNGKKQLFEAVGATEKLNSATKETSKSYDRATGAVSRYKQAQGAMGVAGNARDFSKLSQTIGRGDTGVVGSYATLAANTFAVVAAFTALKTASDNLKVMAGLEAQGARLGKTLTLTAQNMREVTDSALSMADSMRSTAQLIAGGFNSDQIASLTQVAKDASGALGRDLNDAMDRLTRGVTKLEPELLDELGIMTKLDEASRLYATSINKSADSLTAAEKRQAFMNAVLDEGNRKFSGIGDATSAYNSYTRLAAAASDVFTASIGTLARVLSPLAELMASNKWLIVGALALFASTIKEQLLPNLANFSRKQNEIAEETQKNNVAMAKSFGEQASALERLNAAGQKVNAFGNFEKGRAGSQISSLVSDLESGEAVGVERYRTTIQALKEDQNDLAAAMDKVKNKTSESYQVAEAQIGLYDEAVSKVNQLVSGHYQYEAAQHASNAVNAAANITLGNSVATFKTVVESLRAQRAALLESAIAAEAAAGGFTRMEQISVAANRNFVLFSTTIRAIGSAFLNMIPIIGQVIFALGLLKSAYDAIKSFLTTDAQKAYNKAQEEYNTIIEAGAAKIKEYARAQDLAKTSSSAQLDALSLSANAITEVGNKYKELLALEEKAANSSLWDKIKGMFSESAGFDAGILDDKIAESKFWDDSKRTEALKALRVQYGTANDATKKYITQQVEAAYATNDNDKSLKGIRKTIENVTERYTTLVTSTDNLKDSFKNLEQSSTQFIQSSAQSTPVDDLMRSVQATTSSVEKMRIEMLKGSITTEEYIQAMGNIGANSTALLGKSAADMVGLKQAQERMKSLGEGSDLGAYRAAMAEVLVYSKRLEESGQARLEQSEKTIRAAQMQYRELSKAAELENATFKKVSEYIQVGAEGFRARVAHEERLRDIQVQELNVQEAVLQMYKAQNDIAVQDLKIQLTKLELIKQQAKATGEMAMVNSEQNSLILSDFSKKFIQNSMGGDPLVLAQIETLKQNIKDAEDAGRGLSDAIDGLEAQKAAILAQNLSAAEKAAQGLGEELEVSKKFLEQINRYADTLVETNKSINSINEIMLTRTTSIQKSVKAIYDEYYKAKNEAIRALKLREAELRVSNAQVIAARDNNSITAETEAAMNRTLSVSEATYANEEKITKAVVAQLSYAAKLQLLQLAMFDNQKEGIEWQQQGLDMLKKEADLKAQILSSQNSISASARRVARMNSGIPETEQTSKNDSLIAATQELQAVKAAVNLKMAAIDAEYALLNAQKTALEQELIARRSVLKAMGVTDAYLVPLDNAVKILGSIDVDSVRDLAKEGVRMEVRVAEQNLIEAIATANQKSGLTGTLGEFAGWVRDRRERDSATAEAVKELADRTPEKSIVAVSRTLVPGLEAIGQAQSETLTAFKDIEDPLVSIKGDVSAIARVVTGSGVGPTGKPVTGTISGRFGEDRGTHKHGGTDYAAKTGTPIYATHDGVAKARVSDSYGNVVELVNGQFKTLYAHMSKFNVQAGQLVKKGDVIGYVGSTGRSTGPHLHYEVSINGRKVDPEGQGINYPINLAVTGSAQNVARGQSSAVTGASSSGQTLDIANSKVGDNIRGSVEDLNFSEIFKVDAASIGSIKDVEVNLNELISCTEVLIPNLEKIFNNYQMWDGLQGKVQAFREGFGLAAADLMNFAQSLGPDGEVVTAIGNGVSSVLSSVEQMAQAFKSGENTTQAVLGAVGATISAIASISSAASDQRIRNIDAEIAAEQKRDGKSAESQKKIEALERKKDEIARKQFNMNKKLMMAQAVIATATGVANALASGPPPANIIMAGIIGAMGAIQLGIIAGTTYAGGSSGNSSTAQNPSKLMVGKVGNSVNLDRVNSNAGGEIGYLRGSRGMGSNASNYQTIGSAYGGMTNRGYGNRRMLVGEKGPETVETTVPMKVIPRTESSGNTNIYEIHATDAESFTNMLKNNPVPIMEGVEKVFNSSGKSFIKDVDTRGFGGRKV